MVAPVSPETAAKTIAFAGALSKLKAKQDQGLPAELDAAEVDGIIWGIKQLRGHDNRSDKTDVVLASGVHEYWSTHCRHGNHAACKATELAPGVSRKPAQCKTCSAACTCSCHRERS